MGTKRDIATSQSRSRQVTHSQAKTMATAKHMLDALETSAKDNTNIEATFLRMAQALLYRDEKNDSLDNTELSVKLEALPPDEESRERLCACSIL